MPLFSRLLIANRGEIACRIARTARAMGIESIAVYSSADRLARHVSDCDRAYWIGAAPARESYLNGKAIIQAALASGAQAIHPGYGFLSENAAFAQACGDAGLQFIGPSPATIQAMGDKATAKRLMAAVGLPLVQGYDEDAQDEAGLLAAAKQIGYPVLIKARAGGGGKGMRIVRSEGEFPAALAACRRESLASFADERVIIERLIEGARHIEVQIFADRHGHVVHLFDRDCSLQRRHQKVIEEAPAPGLSAVLRAQMSQWARDAARAVGYEGAGTVEFMVCNEAAYFIEMNTRLQVEHPVTEMITGLDLVEWQLRVAAGEPLPLDQPQITAQGHAFEARLCAEDPQADFLPSSGPLLALHLPGAEQGVRVDSGVASGDQISPFYDSMVAKLIVHAADRPLALDQMQRALSRCCVLGVRTNLELLRRLCRLPELMDGCADTALIAREDQALRQGGLDDSARSAKAAVLALLLQESMLADEAARRSAQTGSPWSRTDGWQAFGSARRQLRLREVTRSTLDAAGQLIDIDYRRDGWWLSTGVGWTRVEGKLDHAGHLHGALDGQLFDAWVSMAGEHIHLCLEGDHAQWMIGQATVRQSVRVRQSGAHGAPMPGRIVSIALALGDAVNLGQPLLVIEAMKMEYTVQASVAGTVTRIGCALGDTVALGQILVDITHGPDQHPEA